MNQDNEHLQLLSIFHYVAAGLTALLATLPVVHLVIGLGLLFGHLGGRNPPTAIGWIFVLVSVTFILGGWTMAVLMVLAARRLGRRAAWTFCFFVAILECLAMPYGTVLGVFTIIVLTRASVRAMFPPSPQPMAAA